MRVTAKMDVAIGMLCAGTVVEDADERQGYFWVQRNIQRLSTPRPKPTNLCVPFGAVERIDGVGGWLQGTVHLAITRDELNSLPTRAEVRPQPTVAEMVRALPMMGGAVQQPITRPFPVLPASAPPQQRMMPVEAPPSFADAQALGETVVSQFAQKAELIRAIARIQAEMEREGISEEHKAMLAKEAADAYERLRVITEQTDMQMSAYLSRYGR